MALVGLSHLESAVAQEAHHTPSMVGARILRRAAGASRESAVAVAKRDLRNDGGMLLLVLLAAKSMFLGHTPSPTGLEWEPVEGRKEKKKKEKQLTQRCHESSAGIGNPSVL